MPNIERLKHLVTILRAVPPERFDMGYWECGTVACAVGHACHDPQFQAEGLHLARVAGFATLRPALNRGQNGWPAVMTFFGLNLDQALYLFSMSDYESAFLTTDDVIARIEALIKGTGHGT